jgi:hypothetical protein
MPRSTGLSNRAKKKKKPTPSRPTTRSMGPPPPSSPEQPSAPKQPRVAGRRRVAKPKVCGNPWYFERGDDDCESGEDPSPSSPAPLGDILLDDHTLLAEQLRHTRDAIAGFSAWVVRHANEEPNAAGDIVNLAMGSSAHYLPADLERMGLDPEMVSIPINLFEIRIGASTYECQIFVLGKKTPLVEKLLASLYDRTSEDTTPVGWMALIQSIGLHAAVLELLQRLMGGNVLPCSGIPVDGALATYLEKREASIWPTGQFRGRDSSNQRGARKFAVVLEISPGAAD